MAKGVGYAVYLGGVGFSDQSKASADAVLGFHAYSMAGRHDANMTVS
jgi:hypothetical protein